MNWRGLFFFAACSLTTCAAEELSDAVRSAIDGVSPSVVRIQIVGAPDRAGTIASRVTTGVVVSAEGEIVSSSFGFGSDIAAVFVETADGERHSAEVVATDHVRKLVLLRSEAKNLSPPSWASELPKVGAWSVAVGRFYAGSRPSAALGVVSAVNRIHGLAIQTDAKVSPVNYGGLLVGLNGIAFGILVPLAPADQATGVTAGVKWYDSGIGFAIPSDDVLDSVSRLRSGNDRVHGVLGLTLSTQNLLSPQVEVRSIIKGSPADTGGIRIGDQIVSVNGRPVKRVGGLHGFLKGSWADEDVLFVVDRGGEEHRIEVSLAAELSVPQTGWLGIVPVASAGTGQEDGDGVLAGILPDSPAAAAGLPDPCIVAMVEDEPTHSVTELRSALAGIAEGSSRRVTFARPEGREALQSVSVVAAVRTTERFMNSAAETASIRDLLMTADKATDLTQIKIPLAEQRSVWIVGPKQPSTGSELGVVILLHDGEPVTDAILQDWREVCLHHHIVLAVVWHEHEIPVESIRTIQTVVSEIAKRGPLDPDRMALVAWKSHAAFVTRLLLDPRIEAFRQAVFMECRPTIGGSSLAGVAQKKPAVLLFPRADDRQSLALLTTAAATIRAAGAEVVVRQSSPDAPGSAHADEIARWLLLQKVR